MTPTSIEPVDEDVPPVDPEHVALPSDRPETAAATRRDRFRAAAKRTMVFGLLPTVALLLASGAAFLKWWESDNRAVQAASAESIQAATESTIAMLSYHPDTIDKDLGSARERLTGGFRDSYTSLINDVVIPGAKQKRVSAVTTVPGAASVSVTKNHAVVLVMVNQTTAIGTEPPTQTNSSIRVTLDKVDGRWLVSDFAPV